MRVGKNVTVVYYKRYSNGVVGPITTRSGHTDCDGRWNIAKCVKHAIINPFRPQSAIGFRIYRDYHDYIPEKHSLLVAGFYQFNDDKTDVTIDWSFVPHTNGNLLRA